MINKGYNHVTLVGELINTRELNLITNNEVWLKIAVPINNDDPYYDIFTVIARKPDLIKMFKNKNQTGKRILIDGKLILNEHIEIEATEINLLRKEVKPWLKIWKITL